MAPKKADRDLLPRDLAHLLAVDVVSGLKAEEHRTEGPVVDVGGRALLASRTILPSSHARLHKWRGGSWRGGSPWNAHDRQSPKPLRFSLVTTRFAPGHGGQDERVRAIL